jgi:hypothetical protein
MTQQILKNQQIWTPENIIESGIEDRIVYYSSFTVLSALA